MEYDFSGWATKSNLLCSDGRTILKDAFKHCDGKQVPLVWNHKHDDPNEVLGHAMLKNKDEGVYTYCKFNDTESGKTAKLLVKHGDINALSIYANNLKEQMNNVIHGNIREVSLVLAGANPGAFIDSVICHSDDSDENAAIIYTGENIELYHADEDNKAKSDETKDEPKPDESKKEPETVQDVIDSMTETQKNVMYALMADITEEKEKGANEDMKHNVFDQQGSQEETNVLSHDAMEVIINDAKRYGSLSESFLAHAGDYGIDNIDYLFPEAKTINNTPEFIKRDMGWVSKVMNSVHHTPFSRIKSVFADITEDEARAKGYIKGKLKKEEVFSLLKRTTTPTTVYKKQKLDRDDIVDITDFDVIAWLKSEMRMMLDEEIARAILIGDGRLASSDDHINENNIRPIWKDAELYTVPTVIEVASGAADTDVAKKFIDGVIRSRKNYKGSGNPTLYTTEDMVTSCLLIEDSLGHKIYKSVAELATTLRVSEIVTVEPMEDQKRTVESTERTLLGIIVNLVDYNVGADKGGAVSMFDDFDIDYNQQKYLIETRCSGALVKPKSAMIIESTVATAANG